MSEIEQLFKGYKKAQQAVKVAEHNEFRAMAAIARHYGIDIEKPVYSTPALVRLYVKNTWYKGFTAGMRARLNGISVYPKSITLWFGNHLVKLKWELVPLMLTNEQPVPDKAA